MNAALDGIIVADFSRVLAGPLATTILADLGATVIKVERPGSGDDTRSWGPPWTQSSSSYFESANRTKRSIELDLGDEADREVALELVRRSDVMVENFLTGVLDRFGFGYEQAAAINEGLVYCSITGFGSAGGSGLPGYDFIVQAMGGLMSITGSPDGEPTKVGVALVDVLTSKDAAIAIMAALAARERDGIGQHVEVNLLSTLLGSLANQTSATLMTGQSPERMGNEHPSIVPYQSLHTRDGLLAVACGNDGQFRRLVDALGIGELADDRRFVTNADRVLARPELVGLLEAALGQETSAHWESVLSAVGVPVGQVGDIASAIDRARELGLEPTVDVGPSNPPQIRHPALYSRSTVVQPSPPPLLGEHNDEIRAWLSTSG